MPLALEMSRGGFGRVVGIETLIRRGAIDMQNNIRRKIADKEFERVFDHIHIPNNPPHLILIAGPCRVGTTALANVFARSGIVSYMQPIKSMRRSIENGEPVADWHIQTGSGLILSKETFGIATESEYFDPVDILMRAGYPKDKISLIAIMREPDRTLTSWNWMWEEVLMAGFVRAYRDTLKMTRSAEEESVKTVYYVHEAIRDNDPYLVVSNLMGRVVPTAVDLNRGSVDWSYGNNFDQAEEVRFFDEPPERFVAAVKTWGGYQYKELIPDLTDEQKNLLIHHGVYDIYELFRTRCESDLGIGIHKASRVTSDIELETKDADL